MGYDIVSAGYRRFVYELWTLEVEGKTFSRNVGIRLTTDAASYPRITESSATPPLKPLVFLNSINKSILFS